MAKKYLGVKLVEATKAIRRTVGDSSFVHADGERISEENIEKYIRQPNKAERGYKVVYPDGYVSFSPEEAFEKAYIQVGDNNAIEERNIDEFIVSYDVSQWGDKTTVVHATLANGFIMSESSSCVDPANFNMDIGASICKEAIQHRLWGMLGFMLQAGLRGVKLVK